MYVFRDIRKIAVYFGEKSFFFFFFFFSSGAAMQAPKTSLKMTSCNGNI